MINKKKKYRKTHSRLSIDGVSPSGPRKKSGSIGFESKPIKAPSQNSRRLDDFDRSEGFDHSTSRNNSISSGGRPQYSASQKKRSLLGRRKKPSGKRKNNYDKKVTRNKRLKLAGVGFLILLLAGGFLYMNLRKVFTGGGSAAALQENVDPSELRIEGDGRVNILVMGRGGDGHEGADLTDTMILVSINPINKEAGLVSIPRDLYVSVPGEGSMKINSVFYTGRARYLNSTDQRGSGVEKGADEAGFELTEEMVEKVLGIPVHYHTMVDFSGFKQAIDTVGGVNVQIPKPVYEQMRINGKDYTLNVDPGPKHLDGFEALAYSRSRHTSSRGDFDRSERQRMMILALKEKILSAGTFSNPAKVSSLANNFGNHVQTNFETGDIGKLYGLSEEVNSSKIESIGLADPPNNFLTTSTIDGLSVVVPTAGIDNYEEIHYYIRNTLKDSFLKKEKAKVMILNGTSRPGLAEDKKYELKSYGYKVIGIDDAPSGNYGKTVLVDMNHGDKKYTRHYLQNRFSVVATNSLPDPAIKVKSADFVIILGNDISSR